MSTNLLMHLFCIQHNMFLFVGKTQNFSESFAKGHITKAITTSVLDDENCGDRDQWWRMDKKNVCSTHYLTLMKNLIQKTTLRLTVVYHCCDFSISLMRLSFILHFYTLCCLL